MFKERIVLLNKEIDRMESEIVTAQKWDTEKAKLFIADRECQIKQAKDKIEWMSKM